MPVLNLRGVSEESMRAIRMAAVERDMGIKEYCLMRILGERLPGEGLELAKPIKAVAKRVLAATPVEVPAVVVEVKPVDGLLRAPGSCPHGFSSVEKCIKMSGGCHE